jgi:Bacterial regulatory protein, Fis family
MRGRSAEALVRVMVAKEPQQTADTVLEFLMGLSCASAGAIFALGSGLSLFVARGIGQPALDWASECWEAEASGLRAGRLSRDRRRMLIPAMRGKAVGALLYLEADHADLGSIAEFSSLIVDAVARGGERAEAPSLIESFLESTPPQEIERRKLLLTLGRFEWNLARVARELSISRSTLYKRLEAFGISRQRASKVGDRAAASWTADHPTREL